MTRKDWRNLGVGLAFLAPNILGVLVFTVFPVLFAVMLAFTNWDLRRHNMIRAEPIQFVGLDNFVRLLTEADFLRFLGNTLYLMMGIPFAIGGALLAAIMLNKNPGGEGRVRKWLLAAAVLVSAIVLLAMVGMGTTGLVILMTGVACGVLVLGVSGGNTVYRTLFYTPHFTAGVATYLLWQKLYNPETGPINVALRPVLGLLTQVVQALPAPVVRSGMWLCLGLIVLLGWWCVRRLQALWNDGEVGSAALALPVICLAMPAMVGVQWPYIGNAGWLLVGGMVLALGVQLVDGLRRGRAFPSRAMAGSGSALMLALTTMVVQFILLGLAAVCDQLPGMAANGLEPPRWIHDYYWAKPSIMLMMLWSAIGSNNMLLYLAALNNVPGELYEASDIDGANRWQKFWHVTWPQLAPTTLFILVMSMISGLQGGFEMARTLTKGGPSGATTTLSYFIYTEGFETGRLSFAAAVAWALFLLVLGITMLNWRFGSRYVNE